MQRTCPVFAIVASIAFISASHALTIYDGSLNSAPEAQGYVLLGPLGASAFETQGTGKVTLNTADASNKAGWANNLFPLVSNQLVNPAFPTLNSSTGFVLSFDLKVLSESHTSNDRAGFDVILLDSAHTGVELGFWSNEIWAQMLSGTSFVHGEGNTTVTTGTTTHYDLGIHNGTYVLDANGSQILTGSTRDYSSGNASPNPYGLNNYLFVGDDTSSATASVELSSLSIVPEPATFLGIASLLPVRRRRR